MWNIITIDTILMDRKVDQKSNARPVHWLVHKNHLIPKIPVGLSPNLECTACK